MHALFALRFGLFPHCFAGRGVVLVEAVKLARKRTQAGESAEGGDGF